MTRRRTRSGFTLLELVTATSMVAMLTLALYGAMSTAFRARRTMASQTTAVRQAAIAMDLVAQDLQNVLPPTGTLAGPFVGTAMGNPGAEADSLVIYTLCRDTDPKSDDPFSEGMRQVEIALSGDTQSTTLVRRVVRNVLSQSAVAPQEEVIATDVRALAIRYFDGTTWQEQWDSTQLNNVLPVAVEMSIELNQPAGRDENSYYRITRLIPMSCGQSLLAAEQPTGVAP